jgi:hypothetical protein
VVINVQVIDHNSKSQVRWPQQKSPQKVQYGRDRVGAPSVLPLVFTRTYRRVVTSHPHSRVSIRLHVRWRNVLICIPVLRLAGKSDRKNFTSVLLRGVGGPKSIYFLAARSEDCMLFIFKKFTAEEVEL